MELNSKLSLREDTSVFLSHRLHLRLGWFSVISVHLKNLRCEKLRFWMRSCVQMLPPRNFCLPVEQEQSSCCIKETKISLV